MRPVFVCLAVCVAFGAIAGCRVPNPLYGRRADSGADSEPSSSGEDTTPVRFDADPRDNRPVDDGRLVDPGVDTRKDPIDTRDASQPDSGKDVPPVSDSQPDSIAPDTRPVDTAGACVGTATQLCALDTATTAANSCQVGSQTCQASKWTTCLGIEPVSCGFGACKSSNSVCPSTGRQVCTLAGLGGDIDGCGGGDDDCDGLVNEDCLDQCVHVEPNGTDSSADGTADKPFRTIQAAVNWAAADASHFKRVCVAGVETCGASQKLSYQETLTIPTKVSVQGGYAYKPWQSCNNDQPTSLAVTSEAGVTFTGASAADRAEFSRFAITRKTGANLDTVAGITVSGSKTDVAIISVFINDSPVAKNTYGVRVLDGADAQIFRSSIASGNGSNFASAVQVDSAKIEMRENCDKLNSDGSCASGCTATSTASLGLRGPSVPSTVADSRAEVISLTNVASACLVAANTVCGADADHVVGLHIKGSASRLMVRVNHIEVSDGRKEVDAVLVQDCVDENPRLSDNVVIRAQSPSASAHAHAIRSEGGCPFIDSNRSISVQPAPDGGEAYAIRCYAGNGCRILGNRLISVEGPNTNATVAAVLCEGGSSCPLVSHNVDIRGGNGLKTSGISLSQDDGVVNDNTVSAGCGTLSAVAIQPTTLVVGNTIVNAPCPAAFMSLPGLPGTN